MKYRKQTIKLISVKIGGGVSDVKTKAKKDYFAGIKQKDICKKYDISINTLKSWIKRERWSDLKKELKSKNREIEKKKKEHSIKSVPKKKKSAPKNTRGAPIGNKNSKKHGLYETIMYSNLDQTEIELISDLNFNEEEQLQEQYKLLTVREYRYLKHINKLKHDNKDFIVQSADKSTRKLKRTSSVEEMNYNEDEENITTSTVNTMDMINNYEKELTRIQKLKKQVADSLLTVRQVNAKLIIDKEKLELEKYKIYGVEDEEGQNEAIKSFLEATASNFDNSIFDDFNPGEYGNEKEEEDATGSEFDYANFEEDEEDEYE